MWIQRQLLALTLAGVLLALRSNTERTLGRVSEAC
jgi:hypothetical protein